MLNLAEEIAFGLEEGYHSLPYERKVMYDDLADDLWIKLGRDEEFHEGCVPSEMHVLPSCGPEILDAAHEEACEAALKVLERLGRASNATDAQRAILRTAYAEIREQQEDGPQTVGATFKQAEAKAEFTWE